MREFINIVENARGAILYHGTSIFALASIVEGGHIMAGDPDDGPQGVSLTRERSFAAGFASDVDQREADIMVVNGLDKADLPKHKLRGAILEFDWNALIRDHEVNTHEWDGDDSEQEERVNGDGFHVNDYLIGFVVQDIDLDWWIGAMRQEATYSDEHESRLAHQRAEMIAVLRHHPLRKL